MCFIHFIVTCVGKHGLKFHVLVMSLDTNSPWILQPDICTYAWILLLFNFYCKNFFMVSAVVCFIHFIVKYLDLPGIGMLLLPSKWLLKMLWLLISACHLLHMSLWNLCKHFHYNCVVFMHCPLASQWLLYSWLNHFQCFFLVVRLLVNDHLIFGKTFPVDISVDSRNYEMRGHVGTQSDNMETCITINEVLNSLPFICLFVSLLAGLSKCYCMDLCEKHENENDLGAT